MRALLALVLLASSQALLPSLRLEARGRVGGNSGSRLRLVDHDAVLDLVQQAHVHHGWLADHLQHSWLLADADPAAQPAATATAAAASPYSKVDREGFIGGIAAVIETAIDFGHNALKGLGMQNTYGFAILIFTVLIKAATLPLTSAQIESTTKLQAIAPLQQKILAKYPNKEDENTKNQLLAMLFQAANVNPLAGCFPALVQIPIFLSLYRALTNMVAENKLAEPFFWIPDLEGPVYVSAAQTEESANWLMSIMTGQPSLGWHDTLAFLSVPAILYISQTLSQKVLTPPRDPNRPMTEQEEISQGVVNNLPFIVAFFSVNVPAGLGVYWIGNNIITTIITVVLKEKFSSTTLSPAVEELMAQIDANSVQIPVSMMGGPPGAGGFGGNASGVPGAGSKVIDVEVVGADGGAESAPKELTEEQKLIEEMRALNVKAKAALSDRDRKT